MKFDAYLTYLAERNLKMQQTIIESSNELEELKKKQQNSECLIHNDPKINEYWSEAVDEQKRNIQERLSKQGNYAPGTVVRRPVSRIWEKNPGSNKKIAQPQISKESSRPRFMPSSMASRPPLMKNIFDKSPSAYFSTPHNNPKKIAIMSQKLYDKIHQRPPNGLPRPRSMLRVRSMQEIPITSAEPKTITPNDFQGQDKRELLIQFLKKIGF